MEIPIIFSSLELRYIDADVARLNATGETLTRETYLARRLSKVIGNEVARQRVERRTSNASVIEQAVEALPADPTEASRALQGLGLVMTADGSIAPIATREVTGTR